MAPKELSIRVGKALDHEKEGKEIDLVEASCKPYLPHSLHSALFTSPDPLPLFLFFTPKYALDFVSRSAWVTHET